MFMSCVVIGCDSNFEVNVFFKFKMLLQMKPLPGIKQYVLAFSSTNCLIHR